MQTEEDPMGMTSRTMKKVNSINAEKEGMDLKTKGNNAFRNEDYKSALVLYTQAIDKYPHDPTFFLNRAKTFKNLGQFKEMETDARQAIKLDSKYVKGYLTLGESLIELGKSETDQMDLC